MADYEDKFYERYNPNQGTEQNGGITPEMYAEWKKGKQPKKAEPAQAETKTAPVKKATKK